MLATAYCRHIYLVEYVVNNSGQKKLYRIAELPPHLHSWSEFGREAEYVVVLYLRSKGWNVFLSPASRGPADIIASSGTSTWFIQVKSSCGIPRLRGYEVKRLRELAKTNNGLPVISTFQPLIGGFSTGNYSILFYELDSWRILDPTESPGHEAGSALQS